MDTSDHNVSGAVVQKLDSESFSSGSVKKETSSGGGGSEVRKHIMRNLPRTKGSIKKRLRPLNVPRSNVEVGLIFEK